MEPESTSAAIPDKPTPYVEIHLSPRPASESVFGEADYQVPSRFGLGAILTMLTVFSGLFGGLKFIHAPGHIYFFVAALGLLVCVGQMVSGKVPRGASSIVGAIFIPLWFIGYTILLEGVYSGVYLIGIPCLVIGGAFTGYAVGTLAAGCFLATDLLESAILRWRGIDSEPSEPEDDSATVDPSDPSD